FAAIRAGYDSYAKNFSEMVADRVRLGLNENAGLEGTLRGSVHDIENALKDRNEAGLTIGMLTMRRHEKDFMLRRNANYVEEMKKSAAAFTQALADSSLPAAAKDEITKKLAAYQRDFLAWVAGADDLAGKQTATSIAFSTIEPVIDR